MSAPFRFAAGCARVGAGAFDHVDRDWRGEPVIVLEGRAERLPVSRTFAPRFKAM